MHQQPLLARLGPPWVALLLMCWGHPGFCASPPAVWRIEAERAGGGHAWASGQAWGPWEAKGASEGKALRGSAADALGESKGIEARVPVAGEYRLWVRYMKSKPPATLCLLVRDEDGEVVAFGRLDWYPRLPTERPYRTQPPRPHKAEWVWESVDAVFERPMDAWVSFCGMIHGDGHAPRQVDCVVFSRDQAFSPVGASLDKLPPALNGKAGDSSLGARTAAHAQTFAGVSDPAKRFHLGLINNASMYLDYARIVRLGFNSDHGAWRGCARYGVGTMAAVETFVKGDKTLAEAHPSPEGRFVNGEGKVGRNWSLSFPPLRAASARALKRRMETYRDRAEIECWRMSGEVGGWMDYSEHSQRAFRAWLKARYKTVDQLNEAWGADYASLNDVRPAKSAGEDKANWLDFREFCGQVFADAVAAQAPVIAAHDPLRRPCVVQNSNLDLLAPYFTSMRPMDWEQYINVALAAQPCVGWDTYCSDDYIGCEVDLLQSLAGHRKLINEEWNVHSTDWRIAARSFWTMVGKGVKGIYCFQFQEGTYHDSYPKWALLRHDRTPKQKLGAFADCAHEVHRLEPVLIAARRRDAVKPVALYYSRIDLALDRPLASVWGEGVDSPYHVYEVLRGLGYTVRWITPRQIQAGALAQVSAVVLVNAQHIPTAAAKTLAQWVRKGGAVVGDRWPGAFDKHGRPQQTLAPVFGVRAASARAKKGKIAVEESAQGYGEVTINALDPDERHKTVGEIWQQWDATHPVARALGPYMMSGFGLERVQCEGGQVIGMTFRGRPGVVVNEFGKGHALYVAMLLGSLYSGSATRFEWDSTHSGLDAYRLLDAFLTHAGAQATASADLPPRLRAKLRVEAPLVDDRGNVVVGVTSLNDVPLGPFALSLRWPSGVGRPRQAFVSVGGKRELTSRPFELADGRLRLVLPTLDTHAAILLLRDSGPLVSLRVTGADRGVAHLLRVAPGMRLDVEATVHNPSPRALAAGRVALTLPRGWSAEQSDLTVAAIGPGSKGSATFRVTVPSICAARRLRPLSVRYRSPDAISSPATELVWWESK